MVVRPGNFSTDGPGLRPPRFGVRTLMVAVALLCTLLAAFQAAGPIKGLALTLALLVVLAHVAGNTLGTRLRQHADQCRSQRHEPTAKETSGPTVPLADKDFAPVTSLSQRRPMGRSVAAITVLGALGGALVAVTWYLEPTHSTAGNTILAAVALSVLGGLASFGLATLARVGLAAWWQAHAFTRRTARGAPLIRRAAALASWIRQVIRRRGK